MSAITFLSSKSACSLGPEPPMAKPEGPAMHSKKRLEKALVLFLSRSIKYHHVVPLLHVFLCLEAEIRLVPSARFWNGEIYQTHLQ